MQDSAIETPNQGWLKYWFGWSKEYSSGSGLPKLIHLVDGEKGGVGKTVFSRALLQWFLDHEIPVWGVEADSSNLDLLSTYGKDRVKPVVLTEDEKLSLRTDKLFQFAIERALVVNLPSRSYKPLTHWLEKNEIIEMGKETGVGLVRWFVSNGTHESVNSLKQNLITWGDRIPHVLVRNLYMRDDWSGLENQSELMDLLKKFRVLTIDMPKLDYDERDIIDNKRLTFGDALSGNDLSMLQKRRVKRFLSFVYEQVEGTGLCMIPGSQSTSEQG
jgi:hypothetical protein